METFMGEQTFAPLPHLSGERTLVVKNTFLEFADEVPAPPNLDRAQTAPANLRVRADPNDDTVEVDPNDGTVEVDPNDGTIEVDPNDSSTIEEYRDKLASISTCSSPRGAEYALSSPKHTETHGNGWGDFCPCWDGIQQTDAVFYPNFWPESELYSNVPVYILNPTSAQQDECWSHVTSSQVGPLQDNPPAVAPLQPPSSGHHETYETPQPQTVSIREGPGGNFEVVWNVDARKLRSGDKQAVSPPFSLPCGRFPAVTFKMIIYPTGKNDGKGGASFKNSKGRGAVTIKCEGDVSSAPAQCNYWLAVGSRGTRKTETKHGMHDFSQSAICGLTVDDAEWEFSSFVDRTSDTFAVFLNVTPTAFIRQ